jgi:hypothetical protein
MFGEAISIPITVCEKKKFWSEEAKFYFGALYPGFESFDALPR